MLLSILALFCELFVIRWLSTEIRVFAYFKNLPLMSAFLGLGLGFIWAHKKFDLYKWSAFGLLWLSGLMICAFRLGITYLSFVDPSQFMLFGLSLNSQSVLDSVKNLGIMLLIFVLSTSIFVGLGQRMGKLFDRLEALQAYSLNVLGSLLGTILFSVLCFLALPPTYWLICAGLLFFAVDRRPVCLALAGLGILYGCWAGPFITKNTFGEDYVKTVWSPYYRIDVLKVRAPNGVYKGTQLGYNLYVNYDSFQSILDCSPQTVSKFPPDVQKGMLAIQTQPYRALGKKDQEVLILGSGSGSDIAAALRTGVAHVDAVEIDPCITVLGKELHPEKPYDSARVTLYPGDARNYLKNCKKKYDVIVFAALDSHAAFSALSSLRMDNYVFTKEALQQAYGLLKPGGLVSINFVIPADFLWQRHIKTLSEATAAKLFAFRDKNSSGMDSGWLLAPDRAFHGNIPEDLLSKKVDPPAKNAIAETTDDWPFLFLPKREIPTLYILPIISVLLLSCIPVTIEFARGARQILNWQMFLLGMAFMLLEVRAMADLSLLFGSTWIINSVIISGVMLVILAANFVAAKLSSKSIVPLAGGILASLVVSSFFHASAFSQYGPVLGGAMGTGLFLFPLVFAAGVFALLFRDTKSAGSALAFNLMGGLFGVCLEYLSMSLGIRALAWIAFGLYSGVLILQLLKKVLSEGAVIGD